MGEAMDRHIRVLIADDYAHVRKGLRALLSTYPGVEVVGEAHDGREAVRWVEECQPDVVLMDIEMPIWDGLQATRYIKVKWPNVRIVALTVRATSQDAALSAGADGFLLKGCSSKDLFAAILGDADPPEQEAPSAEPRGGSSRKKKTERLSDSLTAVAWIG
jgi:DNA-binding NarL/FixJ family response regulator